MTKHLVGQKFQTNDELKCSSYEVRMKTFFFLLASLTRQDDGKNIVTCLNDSRRGIGFDIGFIDHFNTQLVITLNYSDVANFHILQITSSHAKYFPTHSVFIVVAW
jgi:hypothetical protein